MNKFVPKVIVAIALASFALLAPGGAEASQIIRPGDRGSEVTFLQERLQSLGYSTLSTDGVYGNLTETAVEDFQANNGLDGDGIVGNQT